MKQSYHTIERQGNIGERNLAEFSVRNGQALFTYFGADRAESNGH